MDNGPGAHLSLTGRRYRPSPLRTTMAWTCSCPGLNCDSTEEKGSGQRGLIHQHLPVGRRPQHPSAVWEAGIGDVNRSLQWQGGRRVEGMKTVRRHLYWSNGLFNFLLSFCLFISNSRFRLALPPLVGVGTLGYRRTKAKVLQRMFHD